MKIKYSVYLAFYKCTFDIKICIGKYFIKKDNCVNFYSCPTRPSVKAEITIYVEHTVIKE